MWTFLVSSEFWKRRRLRILFYCWYLYFLFIARIACSGPSTFSVSFTISQISMFNSISSFSSASLVASSILFKYKVAQLLFLKFSFSPWFLLEWAEDLLSDRELHQQHRQGFAFLREPSWGDLWFEVLVIRISLMHFY